jgi:hypothetical protein
MSIPELSDTSGAPREQPAAQKAVAAASTLASGFIFGVQTLLFEEMVFAGSDMLERAQTEIHLLSELASKMAGAHSVKDIGSMYEECSKHQIEFVRRDTDRLFRHGEHVIEAASKLFKIHPLN